MINKKASVIETCIKFLDKTQPCKKIVLKKYIMAAQNIDERSARYYVNRLVNEGILATNSEEIALNNFQWRDKNGNISKS